jgi:histidine ammonia-lyase
MGTISARHAWKILQNVENVLAIEMICAAQGIDFHAHSPGAGTKAAFRTIRKYIQHMEKDRVLYGDIEKAKDLIVSGEIVSLVEEAIGPLE